MGSRKGLKDARSRRCLICQCPSTTPSSSIGQRYAVSLCHIFGLSEDHPFNVVYQRASYCNSCLNEIKKADLALTRLEISKQRLLRFQNTVYSKLGDNYFRIEDKESLCASYVDFENGQHKERKFTYNEIVKIVFEKIDQDILKWEHFYSEAPENLPTAAFTTDSCTQTDNLIEMKYFEIETPTVDKNCGIQIIVPDMEGGSSIWNCSTNDDAHHLVADYTTCFTDTSSTEPSADVLPQGQFTKAPVNFDDKVYCTYDSENCKRYFYDQYNLQVHIRSFHEGSAKPHECNLCKKRFVDELRLKSHYLRVHSTSEAFICLQCGKGFAGSNLLRDHVRKKHEQKDIEKTYVCDFCSAPFTSLQEHKNHEELHQSKSSPFECVICSESPAFSNRSFLKSHYINTHTEGRIKCEVCGKQYSKTSLKNHLLSHTSTFKCGQCNYAASSQSSLTAHMLSHSNEKPFACEICGTLFKYAKNLTSHQKIHTGIKPFICTICGMTFREMSYLRRHEESHSTIKNYGCPDCDKTFKVRESWKKHLRTHKEGYVPRKKSNNASQKSIPRPKPTVIPAKKSKKERTKKSKSKQTRASKNKKSKANRVAKSKKVKKVQHQDLPSSYQDVEYIQEVDTQKIDFVTIEIETEEEKIPQEEEMKSVVQSYEDQISTSENALIRSNSLYSNQLEPQIVTTYQILPTLIPVTFESNQEI